MSLVSKEFSKVVFGTSTKYNGFNNRYAYIYNLFNDYVCFSSVAIKTGRCTHERKIRDIEEVKRLEIQSRIKLDGSLVSDEERWKKMDMVIRRLTDAQLENIPHGSEFMASLKGREDQFLVSCELHFPV